MLTEDGEADAAEAITGAIEAVGLLVAKHLRQAERSQANEEGD